MKITIIIASIFITSILSAQQIGDGHAINISDFNVPLKSGNYNSSNPMGTTPDNANPWQHLFVIRHTDQNNNYQLQIGSSISTNDRLFFRKISVPSLNSQNPTWYELATRGSNNFVGNQNIDGNVGIGTINPQNKLSIVDNSGNALIASYMGGKIYQDYKYTSISYGESVGSLGNASNIGYMSHQVDKSLSGLYFTNYGESEILSSLFIRVGGNIGIGTVKPNNKLDVNGTIHSKEVKVDMSGWSDFVFKKEYNLPTLAEVEKHIKEKGHLENIPSEEEVLKNGINLGEMDAKLLQKIEEMTLYMIEQNKRMDKMEKENNELKNNQLQLQKTILELTKNH